MNKIISVVLWFVATVILVTDANSGMKIDEWRTDMIYWLSVLGCIVFAWPYVSKKATRSRAKENCECDN